MSGDPHQRPDKADRIRHMFALIAPRYDLSNRVHSFGRDRAWRWKAVQLAEVSPDSYVLDVACGTGDLAFAFADAGARSVVGVDFTEEMLQIAQRKIVQRRRARSAENSAIRFEHGDAMDLRFDDASFNIVSIAFGIRNVADPGAALREFRRVLRPGGRVVILEFTHPPNPLIRFVAGTYITYVMPITAILIAGDRSGAYRYLPRSIDTFLEDDAMVDAIRAAGFERVVQHRLTFGVCSVYIGHAA